MPKKIYAREICPKNICPGNMAKLYMSERHATFDNAGGECSRTIPAKNVRKYNARIYMSKMTMPGKYVHEVDISEIYTGIKGPYVLPVRYAHG